MSRLIKFRGQRTDNDEWLHGSLIQHCDGSADIIYEYPYGSSVHPSTVGEYTGLKAYDEKTEIYEGDIVRDSYGRIMKVGYWDFKLCWIAITKTNFHHADFFDWRDRSFKRDDVMEVEVIGNIHQNPELIQSPGTHKTNRNETLEHET